MSHPVNEAAWDDADEAQRRVLERIADLPALGATREARDLTLLSTLTTVGPLAVFALGVGANAYLSAGLVLAATAALAFTSHVFRRDYAWDFTTEPQPLLAQLHGRTGGFNLVPTWHGGLASRASRRAVKSAAAGGRRDDSR